MENFRFLDSSVRKVLFIYYKIYLPKHANIKINKKTKLRVKVINFEIDVIGFHKIS